MNEFFEHRLNINQRHFLGKVSLGKGFRPDTVVLLTEPDERFQGEGGVTLIDENKGIPENLRHPAWLGFKENDLVANFIFEENVPTIRNITLSYVRNNGMICMPPEEMQVWGGNDPENLQLIKKVNPPQASDYKKPVSKGSAWICQLQIINITNLWPNR